MNATEFVSKWSSLKNHLGFRAVGINVVWNKISAESKVEQFQGRLGWEKIYFCTPPWFKEPKTFSHLINRKDEDYLQIVREETENCKIERYRQNGLQDPFFCAFANHDGSFLLLGDGNHRFINCNHLISVGRNFDDDIKRTELDVIYLKNFAEVIEPQKIWPKEQII